MYPHRIRLMCPECGKAKYQFHSELDALEFASTNYWMIYASNGYAPSKAYECKTCKCWHLSSSDWAKKNINKSEESADVTNNSIMNREQFEKMMAEPEFAEMVRGYLSTHTEVIDSVLYDEDAASDPPEVKEGVVEEPSNPFVPSKEDKKARNLLIDTMLRAEKERHQVMHLAAMQWRKKYPLAGKPADIVLGIVDELHKTLVASISAIGYTAEEQEHTKNLIALAIEQQTAMIEDKKYEAELADVERKRKEELKRREDAQKFKDVKKAAKKANLDDHEGDEVYRPDAEESVGIKQVGFIDLDAINSNMHPAPKTKAEWKREKKEREAAERKAWLDKLKQQDAIKAEEEAKRKAEEEAKRKAEEEAKRKADEDAKRKAEEEAKKLDILNRDIEEGSMVLSLGGMNPNMLSFPVSVASAATKHGFKYAVMGKTKGGCLVLQMTDPVQRSPNVAVTYYKGKTKCKILNASMCEHIRKHFGIDNDAEHTFDITTLVMMDKCLVRINNIKNENNE